MTKAIDETQAERHRAKMANRKARQDEEQGLIIAYDPPGNNPKPTGYVVLPDFSKSA